MRYYKDLKFCTIFSFFESIEDVRYLLILDDYSELPELNDSEIKELTHARELLLNDYSEQETNQSSQIIQLSKSAIRLQNEQNIILHALKLMSLRYEPGINQDLIKQLELELEKRGYGLQYSSPEELLEEIKNKSKRAKSKDNQIKRKQIEIEGLTNKNENKVNYLDIVLTIESQANIKLDIYRDTMIKFLAARKKTIEIIKRK